MSDFGSGDWGEVLDSAMAYYGLDPNNYDIVGPTDNSAAMLNMGKVPNYNDSFAAGYRPGFVEHRNKNGSISWTQGQTQDRRFGRKLSIRLKEDVKKVLVACYLENYDRLIVGPKDGSSPLRESVRTGDIKDGDDPFMTYQFRFQIADIQGRVRWNNDSNRPGTRYYGPIVFQGRSAIVTPLKPMRFMNKGGTMIYTHFVKAAEGKNIFELTASQIEQINKVILRPLTQDTLDWMKQCIEGKGSNGD